MEKSLEEMSGEKTTGSSPKLLLNEIRINGTSGKFLYKNILAGKKEDASGKEKYEETQIGDYVDLIFLKVRRKLSQFKKGGDSLNTNEHGHKSDFVTMFGLKDVQGKYQIKKGIASDLREEYQGLKTIQIVYALYAGELVRLIVKGSSLGSEAKPEDVLDFYSYISSFKKGERDDHFYECYTKLVSTSEEGEQGTYYSMTFSEAEKVTDDVMQLVTEKMTIAFNYAEEIKEYTGSKDDNVKKEGAETIETMETIEYDNGEGQEYHDEGNTTPEGSKPEDVPF